MSQLKQLAELLLAQGRVIDALSEGSEADVVEAKMLLFVKTAAVAKMVSAGAPKRGKSDGEA